MMRREIVSYLLLIHRGLQRRLRTKQSSLISLASIIILLTLYFNFFFDRDDYVDQEKQDAVNIRESMQPNRTWMELRRELLARNDTLAKVALFSYMRGGSTLFSESFNLDPSSNVMWHEPMDAFYQSYAGFEAHSIPLTTLYYKNFTRRLKSYYETSKLINYLDDLLTCQPEHLPIETFAHFHLSYSSALKQVHDCMEEKQAKASIYKCTYPIRSICGHEDLIRRDMLISSENKCQPVIGAIKSLMPKQKRLVHPSNVNPNVIDGVNSGVNHGVHAGVSVSFRNTIGTKSPKLLKEITLAELKNKIVRLFGETSNRLNRTIEILTDYRLCISELEPVLEECVRPALEVCGAAKLSTVKLIRVMMDDLETLLQRLPDLHLFYYVRDPRAMAMSRAKSDTHLTMLSADRSAVTEAQILCQRMREDLTAKKHLENKYPGSIITIRYEDFVQNPLRYVEQAFKRIRRPVPSNILSWIQSRFNGTEDNGIYGTVRMNPGSTSVKWMSEINLNDALKMEKYCHDVLHELGYMTLSSKESEVTRDLEASHDFSIDKPST